MGEYKVMLFLMGLNDVHAQVWTQILSMKPMPGIDEAYNMVLEGETEKGSPKPTAAKMSTMYVTQGEKTHSNAGKGYNPRR